uniref:Uncharacterized protein n=1 Tax=Chlamydomonas euryale TaxID=1486919 RepID=A0A7R9YVU5_9CHLO|mmetsp:Transcript_28238/g.83611  ORF Transcript_28238/g.83611 Transcript_28238/m.83611 type:complete len:241 (+) Transcript_28238:401-1123(+)
MGGFCSCCSKVQVEPEADDEMIFNDRQLAYLMDEAAGDPQTTIKLARPAPGTKVSAEELSDALLAMGERPYADKLARGDLAERVFDALAAPRHAALASGRPGTVVLENATSLVLVLRLAHEPGLVHGPPRMHGEVRIGLDGDDGCCGERSYHGGSHRGGGSFGPGGGSGGCDFTLGSETPRATVYVPPRLAQRAYVHDPVVYASVYALHPFRGLVPVCNQQLRNGQTLRVYPVRSRFVPK